jgi:hypothetical protein
MEQGLTEIKVLYISDIYEDNQIYPSQVRSLLDIYKTRISTGAIYFSRKAENRLDLQGRKLVIRDIPLSYVFSVMRGLLLREHRSIKQLLEQDNYDLIVGRGLKGANAAILINKWCYAGRKKVVMDLRGDAVDENKRNFFKQLYIKRLQHFIFRHIPHFFVVSRYLKETLVKQYRINPSRVSVFSTIVPAEKFYFDGEVAAVYRKNLGFDEHDIVFVYSGNAAWYQNLEFILKSFLTAGNERTRLLVLTRDIAYVQQAVNGHPAGKRIKVLSAPYQEVSRYLQACDYGLLIRDNIPTNLSASPTKFGEYVNSGLSVVFNKINTDYYYQSIELGLNNVILDKKEELSTFFRNVADRPGKNTTTINTAEQVADEQLLLFREMLTIHSYESTH